MNIAIDFEYNKSSEKNMGLVSCSACLEGEKPWEYWLEDGRDRAALLDFIAAHRNAVWIGYEIQLAEARCFAALGLDPSCFYWRDLLAEWRWLRNETNQYKYGNVVKNQLAYFTVPPVIRKQKRMTVEETTEADRINEANIEQIREELEIENVAQDEAGYSLLDCLYFFELMTVEEYRIAAKQKDEMRGQILAGDCGSARDEIMAYNSSDIKDLFALEFRLTKEMLITANERHITVRDGSVDYVDGIPVAAIQLRLGTWCARLAKYANRGLPLDPQRLARFLEITPRLTKEIKENWNREHPAYPLYRVGLPESILEKRKRLAERSPYIECGYTKDTLGLQRIVERYCAETGITNWPKTRQGAYITDKKALSTFAAGENIIKQLERHSGQISNLKAFTADGTGQIEALNYIGDDNRQRPDFGPHGTQTDRNAHKAKTLLFANAHWMRILLNPEPGMALIELDYGSEEVFIAAALTGDQNLMAAYLSQDVYMFYAQLTGMYPRNLPIPTEAQRSEEWFKPHKRTRQIAKTLCLSIQYGAGAKSVAAAISNTTGEPVTLEQGIDLIRGYREAYPDYARTIQTVRDRYTSGAGILLHNGWRLGPDSPSVLSASNLPIQGTGSCILQEACKMIDEEEIEIVATMHDSITAYGPEQYAEQIAERMRHCMLAAADKVLDVSGMKVGEAEIVRHGDYWIHGDKAARDWPKYKKYFENI
jgi:hypothetical protein